MKKITLLAVILVIGCQQEPIPITKEIIPRNTHVAPFTLEQCDEILQKAENETFFQGMQARATLATACYNSLTVKR